VSKYKLTYTARAHGGRRKTLPEMSCYSLLAIIATLTKAKTKVPNESQQGRVWAYLIFSSIMRALFVSFLGPVPRPRSWLTRRIRTDEGASREMASQPSTSRDSLVAWPRWQPFLDSCAPCCTKVTTARSPLTCSW